MLAAATSKWVLRRPGPGDAVLRLFCFPCAGGTPLTYHTWNELLPSAIEVSAIQLPGRGFRAREEPCRDLETLARAAADGLRPFLDEPFALFGHSLGALTAFELARELRRRG